LHQRPRPTMFSWSQTATKRQSSASQYPGRRSSNGVHAPVVEGSIRPPNKDLTRAQHLESYLEDATLQRSTRRVSSDDTTYDTVFQTTQGDTLIIRVHVPLSSSFASFCPAMTLAGVRVRHDWVEDGGRSMRITGYEPIQDEQHWKKSGLSLGQAVHAVVQHLQLNPPEILEITDAGLRAIQPKNSRFRTITATNDSNTHESGNSSSNNNNHHHQGRSSNHPRQSGSAAPPSYHATLQQRTPQLPPPPDVPLPLIPRDFDSILQEKTREELETLLSDELEFLSLVHRLDVFGEIQQIASSKADETSQLAQENLAKEDTLKSLLTEVGRLQASLQSKVERFQALERKQDALCAPPDIKSTLRQLKEAKKQAFDASEEFAEEWVEDGAQNVDQFVKEFIAQRKVHHERAAKMEILEQQGTR